MNKEFQEKRQRQLKEAQEFEDFIVDMTRRMNPCMIVLPCKSQQYQYNYGESFTSQEIKHDCKRENGSENIYIEIAEKTDPDNEEYVPSGIYRNDNSINYLIGTKKEAFMFKKSFLKKIHVQSDEWKKANGVSEDKENADKTSRGFLWNVNTMMSKYKSCFYYLDFVHMTIS